MPFSEACERNKAPILAVLREAFADRSVVLEIGSGTGQHAVYFARSMPWLRWQASEVAECLGPLARRLEIEGPDEMSAPVELDLARIDTSSGEQPAMAVGTASVDAIFTANTLHIVAWPLVEALLVMAARRLPAGGLLAAYGPFRYGERHTAPSNASFDAMLRNRDPTSGVRDAHAVDAAAARLGLELEADHDLPANNRLRLWRRTRSQLRA